MGLGVALQCGANRSDRSTESGEVEHWWEGAIALPILVVVGGRLMFLNPWIFMTPK